MGDSSESEDDMDATESTLQSLLEQHLHADWEYFSVIQGFAIYLDNRQVERPEDNLMRAFNEAIAGVLKSGSQEILNYIPNEYFMEFYKTFQSKIDNLTKVFNVKFKIRRNKISIHPWNTNQNLTESQVAVPTVDGKRRLVSVEATPSTSNSQPSTSSVEQPPAENQTVTSVNSTINSTIVTFKPKVYNIYYEITPNYKDILKFFNDKFPTATGKITGNLIRLSITSVDHYRTIQAFLDEKEIPFRTLDPRSERPRKVLIRGLPVNTPISDIEAVLKDHKLEALSIAHLRSRKAENKGTPLPLYVVTLRATPNFEEVYNIETINYLKITVERFKSQQYRQCYRCQAYGHSSQQCRLKIKCLKCSEPHNSKDCPVTNSDLLKCANCEGNHPSNFRGCPKHPMNRTQYNPANSKKINIKPVVNARPPPQMSHPNRAFSTPASNPWHVLSTLVEEESVVGTTNTTSDSPGTIRTANKKPVLKPTASSSKNSSKNRTPSRGTTSPPKQESTFKDLMDTFQEIKELMGQYNIKDILNLLKTVVKIFTNKNLELIDKIAAIFMEVTNYCNPPTDHE